MKTTQNSRQRIQNESMDYSDETIPYSSIPVEKGAGMTRVSLFLSANPVSSQGFNRFHRF